MTTKHQQLNADYLFDFLKANQILNKPLVVAVSGGVDSMVMLRLALELRYQQNLEFSAIHVNHGISNNSDEWQTFVESFCEINEIKLVSHQLSLSKQPQKSLEQVARDARYALFSEHLKDNTSVLTGHHSNDQLETFLLRLSRGSGARGLSAMSQVSLLPNQQGRSKSIKLARPLLPFSKLAVLNYAKETMLDWVEDESNQSINFDRNYIRNEISPLLLSRWPHYANAVNISTEHLNANNTLLNDYLQEDLATIIESDIFGLTALNLTKWQAKAEAKQQELLRMYVEQQCGIVPSRKLIMEIKESLLKAEQDKQPKITFNGYELRRYRHYLFCSNWLDSEIPQDIEIQESSIFLPVGSIGANKKLIISWPKAHSIDITTDRVLDKKIVVKWQQSGDRIQPNETSGSKKVNDYLKQQGCPAWLRNRVPMLYINDELAAVVGFAINLPFQSHLKVAVID